MQNKTPEKSTLPLLYTSTTIGIVSPDASDVSLYKICTAIIGSGGGQLVLKNIDNYRRYMSLIFRLALY